MYQVEVNCPAGYQFEVVSGRHKIIIDSEKDQGISPLAALLASLGSCAGVYIRKFSDMAKFPLGSFKIQVRAELTRERPFSFREIDLTVEIEGADLEESRIEAIRTFIKNCPVHQTLKINPEIKINFGQVANK